MLSSTMKRAGAVVASAMAVTALTVVAAPLAGEVRIAGSSTVAPITMAIAEAFRATQPGVQVQNAVTGTGGGFKRFCVGETDISNASRPIKGAEFQTAKDSGVEFIELPVAYDGLSICVNKANYWCNTLTMDQVKAMFADGSTVKTWNDLNPEWPKQQIKMFIPGTDSGTFDYFKEVVVGEKGNIRADVTVSEDDNILVQGIANEPASIGFFGCAYYFENADKLKVVSIDNGDGPILPTVETIENGSYAPFSRPLFIYVNARAAQRPEVKGFIEFYFRNAATTAAEVGYVALPRSVYNKAMRNFNTGHTGTAFLDADGNKVHGSLTEVY